MIIGALLFGLFLYVVVMILIAMCGKALRGWLG
jgi:hypothetical protein